MKRVYISYPFRSLSTNEKNREYGIIKNRNYKHFLVNLYENLKNIGYEVYLPHRDKGKWGEEYILPEDISEICFRLIEKSDIMLVFPFKSRGVHIEIGYAAALRKKILIFLEKKEKESTLIKGLLKITECEIFRL